MKEILSTNNIKRIPLPFFIIPFGLLSAFSVTEFFVYNLSWLTWKIELPAISVLFLPTTILPGIIFSTGIYWYSKNKGIRIKKNFILRSTLVYFQAYFVGYFAGVFSLGILATATAVIFGTYYFLETYTKYTGLGFTEFGKVFGSIVLGLIFGFASFGFRTIDYLESGFIGFWGNIQEGYPLASFQGFSGDIVPDTFGQVLPGTQVLIFVWQIIMALVIYNLINKHEKTI